MHDKVGRSVWQEDKAKKKEQAGISPSVSLYITYKSLVFTFVVSF
jgi:hypothetical protein